MTAGLLGKQGGAKPGAFGRVKIETTPPSDVYMAGDLVGRTPMQTVYAPLGRVTFEFELPGWPYGQPPSEGQVRRNRARAFRPEPARPLGARFFAQPDVALVPLGIDVPGGYRVHHCALWLVRMAAASEGAAVAIRCEFGEASIEVFDG